MRKTKVTVVIENPEGTVYWDGTPLPHRVEMQFECKAGDYLLRKVKRGQDHTADEHYEQLMFFHVPDDAEERCTCGGQAYECSKCNEKRCMECDKLTDRDEVKTAVRWCPEHRSEGRLGRL